jgi:hypothetical protein
MPPRAPSSDAVDPHPGAADSAKLAYPGFASLVTSKTQLCHLKAENSDEDVKRPKAP